MKVIAINGSPRSKSNTGLVLEAMAVELAREGIETELIQVGNQLIHGCTACGACKTPAMRCVFHDQDMVAQVADKIDGAQGLILGCPTYYAGIPGTMKSFLDRLFYPQSSRFRYKVATGVSVVRRTGGLDVVHQLQNYLGLAMTVTPPSQYWTTVYAGAPGNALEDGEGMQTVRRNAQSMAWLMKMIDATKESIPLPPEETRVTTSFIR